MPGACCSADQVGCSVDDTRDNVGQFGEPQRRRWLVLLAAHLSFFLWEGLGKSLGVLLQSIALQLDTETWSVGVVIGIMAAARGCAGPLLRVLEGRFQYRHIGFVSGLVAGAGVIGASFATNILQFALCIILFTGPATGLILNISLVLLAQYFQTLYACANGVAFAGSSVGILLFAPLTRIFLNTYGWRGALLLVGGLQLHLAVLGSLLRSTSSQPGNYTRIQTDERLSEDENKIHEEGGESSKNQSSCWTFLVNFAKGADLHLFLELPYITLLVCFSNLCFVYISWLIYMIPHLTEKGLSTGDTTVVVWAGGIGVLVGQIGHGLLVDYNLCSGRIVLYMANIAMALTLLSDPLLLGKWPLSLCNFFFGTGYGVALPLTYTMMRGKVGVARMTNALGWAEFLGGFFRISASFFTGWFHDKAGNYNLSYVVLGCAPCVAIVTLIMDDAYRIISSRMLNNTPIQSPLPHSTPQRSTSVRRKKLSLQHKK